jgi:hypothetical protein
MKNQDTALRLLPAPQTRGRSFLPRTIKQKQQTAAWSLPRRVCCVLCFCDGPVPFYMDGHVAYFLPSAMMQIHKHIVIVPRGPWLFSHPQTGWVLSLEFKVEFG